jgi:hypothetical protein
MALRRAPPPPEADEILARNLEAVAPTRDLGNDAVSPLATGDPLRVLSLGAEDLVRRRGLDAALFIGWQYFIFEGERSLGVAQVADDGRGRLRFSHFNQGRIADAALMSVRSLRERVPAERDYEPCLLDIPAVFFVGLLLAGPDPLILPIEGTPPGLEPDRAYPAAQVLEELRPQAERVLAHRVEDEDGIP